VYKDIGLTGIEQVIYRVMKDVMRWRAKIFQGLWCLKLVVVSLVMGASIVATALTKPASDPYEDCIKGYDLGAGDTEVVIVSPLNMSCVSICDTSCLNLLSRKNAVGLEINDHPIQRCLESCRKGVAFKGSYMEMVGGELIARGPVETPVRCFGDLQAKVGDSKTEFRVGSGERFKLRIIDSVNASKVAMCGTRSASLVPLVQSIDPNVWASSTTPPAMNKNISTCAYEIPVDEWNVNSISSLLAARNDNSICSWNVRNPLFTGIGIYVQDGDELTISWSSTAVYNPSIIPDPSPTSASRRNIYQLIQDSNTSSGLRSQLQDLLEKQSFLQVMRPDEDITQDSAKFWTIEGNKADTNDPVIVSWKGLNGSAATISRTASVITTGSNCDSQDKRNQNPDKCYKIDDPGLVYYSFSGVLKDFSSAPTPLAFRHWDSSTTGYSDNLGGSSVNVIWSGCVLYNGERLQYAIAENTPAEQDWLDVPPAALESGQPMYADKEGVIYFRVQPITPPDSLNDDEKLRYTDPAHWYGQYYVSVSKIDDSGLIKQGGIIKKLVDSVRHTINGNPSTGSTGVIEKLFKALIEDSSFIAVIRAMLVLFVAFTGVGYIMGTITLSQGEVVKRLLKIGVLVALISPGSWEFFSVNLFGIFLDGGIELIANVVVGSIGTSLDIESVRADPTLIFAIFDGPFQVWASKQLWLKLSALLLHGSLAFLLGVVLFLTMIYYFLALTKVTMMFLMSVIIIALLLFASPFFIACSLFSMTQNFFNSWWKFLISFTLQPVAVFSSVAIFNLLVLIMLQTALSFTVCPACLLKIPFLNKCLIPYYQILSVSHYPGDYPGFLLPSGIVESIIVFFLLTHAMYKFCEFVVSVTNMIVSGQMINVTSLQDYGQALIETGKWVVGRDDASKVRRQQQRPPSNNTTPPPDSGA
jgi:type IV secretion system protein VirB6